MKNFYDKEPTLSEQGGLKIKENLKKGLATLLIICVCIACYFAFLRFDFIADVFEKISDILRPVIYGFVIAYLLNPVMKFVEKHVSKVTSRIIKNGKRAKKVDRSISIFSALVFAFVIVSALVVMLVPELVKSINDLIEKMPTQIQEFIDYISKLRHGDWKYQKIFENVLVQGSDAIETWAKTNLFGKDNILMTGITGITTGVINVLGGILDVVIGIFVSIYALYSKEEFLCQGRKLLYAIAKPKQANVMLHILRKSNSIFSGFIIGKIIDSAIIGVLCFIGVSILRMPYALLVSVFVGVTNVIPYFGPFIGAIPTSILIFIVDPIKGIYFVIFIFLLQQLDGNVIGPKILGDSTGLSAFWVLFSILLFGGLFGVPGMIVGVPTFAVIYYVVELYITQKLKKRELPVETEYYNGENYVDNEGRYVVYTEETTKKEEKKGE